MSTGELGAIISIVTALLSFCGTVYFGLVRQAKIEARVELMWSFMMRKGLSEALISGLVERQSPLKVSVAALERHADLIDKIKIWYEKFGKTMPDLELTVAMETIFHTEFEKICLDEKILPSACVSAMLFFLRPESKIFDPFRRSDWVTSHSPGR